MSDAYIISVERDIVEGLKYFDILKFFRSIEKTPDHGFNSVVLTFAGYDDIADEVFEIEAIRKWVDGLFSRIPHLLYFLNDFSESRQNLLSCYCDIELVYLGERKSIKEWEEQLGDISLAPKMPVALTLVSTKRKLIEDGLRKFGVRVKDTNGVYKIKIWLDSIFKN